MTRAVGCSSPSLKVEYSELSVSTAVPVEFMLEEGFEVFPHDEKHFYVLSVGGFDARDSGDLSRMIELAQFEVTGVPHQNINHGRSRNVAWRETSEHLRFPNLDSMDSKGFAKRLT